MKLVNSWPQQPHISFGLWDGLVRKSLAEVKSCRWLRMCASDVWKMHWNFVITHFATMLAGDRETLARETWTLVTTARRRSSRHIIIIGTTIILDGPSQSVDSIHSYSLRFHSTKSRLWLSSYLYLAFRVFFPLILECTLLSSPGSTVHRFFVEDLAKCPTHLDLFILVTLIISGSLYGRIRFLLLQTIILCIICE